jgi:hypothetical protein
LLLDVAKGRLTVLLEVAAYRASQLALDLGVGIDERPIQPACKLAPDCRLPASRHTDQDDGGHG